MSDDFEEQGKKTQESDFDRDLKKGPLSPANEDLFNFLDNLFTGEGEFPERIEVRTVRGRNKDQYGVQIFQKIYKSGSSKPSREGIVMLTNQIAHRIRVQTDVLQKEATYMIGAFHAGRGDDFYEIMSLSAKPSKRWKNGDGREVLVGEDGEEDTFANKYNNKMLDHFTQFFGLIGGMMEGLIDRSDRQAAAAFQQLERAQAKNIELLEVNLKLVQADEDRAERREKAKMWRENIDKGLNVAWGLLPPMIGGLTSGKNGHANWLPGTVTSESFTLEAFFKRKDEGGQFTQEEFDIIFGKMEDGKLVAQGILTIDQGQLLGRIASKEINPEQIDALLPDGPIGITQEQVMAIIQSGIDPMKLAPLKALFDVRMAKRAEKNQNGGK